MRRVFFEELGTKQESVFKYTGIIKTCHQTLNAT